MLLLLTPRCREWTPHCIAWTPHCRAWSLQITDSTLQSTDYTLQSTDSRHQRSQMRNWSCSTGFFIQEPEQCMRAKSQTGVYVCGPTCGNIDAQIRFFSSLYLFFVMSSEAAYKIFGTIFTNDVFSHNVPAPLFFRLSTIIFLVSLILQFQILPPFCRLILGVQEVFIQ